jgi:hypothetical protein
MLMGKSPVHPIPFSEEVSQASLLAAIASYWNEHIHDLEIATS